MKIIVSVVLSVLLFVGVALACDNTWCNDPPIVKNTRLISHGPITALVLYVDTCRTAAMYKVGWKVFNKRGELVEQGRTEWFYYDATDTGFFAFETELENHLKGETYYVKANVFVGQEVCNER